ncbi:NtaA/DmoA family FMN-dependent monooxygenase [Micromonospora pallida]|nr:NtaA/DmoA family FMN-dependent monooxygenase [Micromonospora pallida]
MIINLDIRASQFNAFWRLPETDVAALYDFETYRRLAQRAEAVAIHALFDADSLGINPEDAAYTPSRIFEPTGYFSALAASTSRIGLIGTWSTTFNEPFNLARKLASLDHLSKGRAGFNLVTSALDAAARNFGLDELPEHDQRYARAAEFVEVIRKLWTSFDADALVADKETGLFTDPGRVHRIDHEGTFFKVRGPLTTFRPPQGWPVLSQAGESEAGKALAARYAELVYTGAHNRETAKAYRDELRVRAEKEGRDPDSIKLVQALHGAMADTRAEVEDYMARITALTPATDELRRWERMTGWDLSALAESDPLPPLPDPRSTNNYQTQLIRMHQMVESEGITTVGELIENTRQRKHSKLVVGSVGEVADHMQDWVEYGAVDGFVVGHGDQTRYGVDAVLDKLVPELQRRGAFRTEYTGTTLRENYGLPAAP